MTYTSSQSFVRLKYRPKLDGNNEVPRGNTTAEAFEGFKTNNDMMMWKMNITGLIDERCINYIYMLRTDHLGRVLT